MTVKFAVLDLETTGTNPNEDQILEVGCILLDDNLNEMAEFHSYVNDLRAYSAFHDLRLSAERGHKASQTVLNMHMKSELIFDLVAVNYIRGIEEVADKLDSWLYDNGVRNPEDTDEVEESPVHVVGSSIHFDFAFLERHMPGIPGYFHHRRCDASAFQIVAENWVPALNEKRKKVLAPSLAKKHRVMSDCRDSVEMIRFYVDELGGSLHEH